MPKGIPVGTLAIGEDGASNAALIAASIVANNNLIISICLPQGLIKAYSKAVSCSYLIKRACNIEGTKSGFGDRRDAREIG